MSDTVLKVEGLYKKFTTSLRRSMYYGSIDAFRGMVGLPVIDKGLRKNEFWALQDINFELKRGETLGLIGPNGCGKTTLLRMINGIFPPDRGKISIKGRIGALIAVGAGFHPHMTGRENVFLNASILGMKKEEIKRKFDAIVDFAEIGEFIDAPVSTYSSGMTVRLGFAIAIHADIDILLVDEILAVGDMKFQQKCFAKIGELVKKNVAIILVSHDMYNIQKVCRYGLVLTKGTQKNYGKVENVIGDYFEENKFDVYANDPKLKEKNTSSYNITYQYIKFINQLGKETNTFTSGEDITVEWKFILPQTLHNVTLHIGLQSDSFTYNGYSTHYDGLKIPFLDNETSLKIVIQKPTLSAGKYHFGIGIWDENFIGSYFWDYETPGQITIENPRKMLSRFEFAHQWTITNNDYTIQKQIP